MAVAALLAIHAMSAGAATAQPTEKTAPDDVLARGEYIFNAAGCLGCHTDTKGGGKRLAGGRALETPFGTFYGPNITPDPEHGIGRWTDADFIEALRHGRSPEDLVYFPAFPYTAFTRMTEADMLALKAYLFAQEPVAQPNRAHDLNPPFGWRFMVRPWQWLFFDPGEVPIEPGQSPEWHRGRYLVEALGHCGECHTPRNFLGALDRDRHMAGTPSGPEGSSVPNITFHPQDGIGAWSDTDLNFLFEIGMMPDGDFVGAGMSEIVQNSTSRLTPEDRAAMITYLKSLPPIAN